MANNTVSIIVPCYNQAQYLPETLDSVLAQTYIDWECIIVNDGSPDNAEEVAMGYCDRDSRFKYLKQENQGPSAARNNGIHQSCGKYILPLDGDDLIAPTYLEKAVSYLESNEVCKLVYCQAELFGEKTGLWQLEEYDYDKFIWSNCIFCTALFRRADFELTRGYNINMLAGFEDWDFWLSFLKPLDIVHRLEEVLFRYRIKTISRNEDAWHSMAEEVFKQLCQNHPEIYSQYSDTVIWLHCQLSIKDDMLKMKTEELEGIKNSRLYKLLLKIMKPIRKVIDFSR